MPKYLISWEESVRYDVVIEAAFKQEALDKFYGNHYQTANWVGQEMVPDTVEVKEV